ncbi:MAG TPA: cupin domain-containing protein [Puia sp.]|nr:cupin domain-containing protein [Puia sp.]
MKVTKDTGRHYIWGGNCDGWHLVETENLSVIEERIPPEGGEILHYHERAQQFFYILSGVAAFETDGVQATVSGGEGYRVAPGARHRIHNPGKEDLRFLVVSQPKSHGDRVNI